MYSYTVVETALARVYAANPQTQVGAFRARIRNFQKLGIPLGIKPGRGKRIHYSAEEVYQWMFCLELAEFGINPGHIAEFLKYNWNNFVYAKCILPAVTQYRDQLEAAPHYDKPRNDWFFALTPDIMSSAWTAERDGLFEAMDDFKIIRESDAAEFFADMIGAKRRRCILNISEMVRSLAFALPQDHPDSIEFFPYPLRPLKRV